MNNIPAGVDAQMTHIWPDAVNVCLDRSDFSGFADGFEQCAVFRSTWLSSMKE